MSKPKSAFIIAKYRYEARKQCPWATIVIKFSDGFKCFETEDGYKAWLQA